MLITNNVWPIFTKYSKNFVSTVISLLMDTSLIKNRHLELVPASPYIFYLTLYKMVISLNGHMAQVLKASTLQRVDCKSIIYMRKYKMATMPLFQV